MIAIIGLSIVSICLLIFYYTFNELIQKLKVEKLYPFSVAYLFIAFMFGLWSLGVFSGSTYFLKQTMILGNLLFLGGTLSMVYFLVSKKKEKSYILLLSAVVFLLYFVWRLSKFPIEPYMSDGILVFNTASVVSAIVFLLVVCIWIPGAVKVAEEIAKHMKQKEMKTVLAAVYLMSISGIFLVISAKQISTILLSYFIFLISFVIVLVSNEMVLKLHGLKHI